MTASSQSSGATGAAVGGGQDVSSRGQRSISSETVGSLLSEKLDEVAQLRSQFDAMKVEAENSPAQLHSKHVANIRVRIGETEKMLMAKAETYQQLNSEFKSKKAQLIELQEKVDSLDQKIEELKALETDENKATLEKLQALIKQHELVKATESAYKSTCKKEMESLTNEVTELKAQ